MRTNRVGRSVVSATTQTPASGPAGPETTPPMSSLSIGTVAAGWPLIVVVMKRQTITADVGFIGTVLDWHGRACATDPARSCVLLQCGPRRNDAPSCPCITFVESCTMHIAVRGTGALVQFVHTTTSSGGFQHEGILDRWHRDRVCGAAGGLYPGIAGNEEG